MRRASIVLAILCVSPAVVCGAAASDTVVVEAAGTTTWEALLQAEASRSRTPEHLSQRAIPHMPMPPARDLLGDGLSPAPVPQAMAPLLVPPGEPTPTPPTVTGGFVALPDNNTSIPPDTMGAVGPSHAMTMLNTEVRIQTKAGGAVSTVSLSTFWTSGTGLSGSPFDPRLVYDAGSGRWLATVDADANSASSQVWFAISATSSPTGAWTFFGFTADGGGTTWADFPGFGVNGTWIAITNNMFSVSALPSFAGSKMWVIDKSTALAGGPLTTTVFPTSFDFEGTFATYGFALQPAVTFGAEPALHIVDSTGFSSAGTMLLRLSRITGTGAVPSWSVAPGSIFAGTGLFLVTTNFNAAQIWAEQSGVLSTCDGGTFNGSACLTNAQCDPAGSPGICRRVDTGDARVSSLATFRNGRVWATHSGGLPASGTADRTAVFWYELDPTALPAPVVQSGVLDGGTGVSHFYPSIGVNMNSDACVGFSRSDASKFVEAVAAGRLGTETAGTMGAIAVLKAGEDSYYKVFSGNRSRWGDYSATVVDPADDLTIWSLQEYAALSVGGGPTDDRWSTWWGIKSVTTSITTTSTTTTTTIPPPCSSSPLGGCVAPTKAVLLVKETVPGNEKLKAVLKQLVPAVTQSQFGDPVSGTTAYNVCVYDDTATLIADLLVARAGDVCGSPPVPCWKAISTFGYKYKDKAAASDGVQKIVGKGGDPLKGKVVAKAGNNAALGQTSLPTGIAAQLLNDTQATVQVVASDGSCFGATLTNVKRADGTLFKAIEP